MTDQNDSSPENRKDHPLAHLSRRRLLVGSSATLAAAGIASIGAATAHAFQDTSTAATPQAAAGTQGTMPGMQMLSLDRASQFFDMHEAQTIDVFLSRLLPGSADDPGAHEAGVVFYIDRVLGGANLGYDLKTYTQGPFLVVEEEPTTVEQSSTTNQYQIALVAKEQAPRYGYQSVLTPQQVYRRGIGFLDAYAQSKHDNDFASLSGDQQDAIIADLEADKATGFGGPTARAFFTRVRNDMIEGMFSDPMYGGNVGLVGWKLIGYPGAQRNYTPDDIANPKFSRPPQSLAQMMASEGQ
jgi:gluconate 2-dehydrogenase gamma chain